MSKYVKKLEMSHLKGKFGDVSDLVVVNVVGMDALENNRLRLELRKKGIQLKVVKNTLAQKVLSEMGQQSNPAIFEGPSAIAWGGAGIVELAKEITQWAKKLAKLQVKGGFVSGQAVDIAGVEQLSELPSREELLGRVVNLALAPAARVVALAQGPGAKIASQLETIAGEESGEEESSSPAAATESA